MLGVKRRGSIGSDAKALADRGGLIASDVVLVLMLYARERKVDCNQPRPERTELSKERRGTFNRFLLRRVASAEPSTGRTERFARLFKTNAALRSACICNPQPTQQKSA